MNSSEETQLSDDLRRIVQTGASALDLDAVERRGCREQRRTVALRGLTAAGVAGIAVAGSLAAFRHPGTAVAVAPAKTASGQRASATASVPAPQLDNVAYVRQQMGAAHDPANSVVEMRQSAVDASNPAQTVWTDPTTANEMTSYVSASGKVTTWQHQYLDSQRVVNLDDTEVDYGPRTWSYSTQKFGAPWSGPAPTTPVNGITYIPATEAKNMLAEGNVKIVGHPVVDGHRTVELSIALGKQGKAETMYLYVDSQTFQVVRLVRVFFPDSAHPASATSDYTWVKRAPALTKLINHPQIPAGFTQVPADS